MTSYIIHLCVYPKSRQFLTLSRFKRVFFSSVATYFLSSHVRSGANIVGYENIVLYIERAFPLTRDQGLSWCLPPQFPFRKAPLLPPPPPICC